MTRWAMVADLERCVGCQTCTAACRHANATSPAVQWRKVLDIEAGSFPNVNRTFVPVGCQHCADPPCMHVCPSTATRQRADGIVTIDYDICIGCAYCDVACPYQARFKITKEDFAYGDEAMQNEIEREDPARLGVAQKCTFCSDRIDFGIENGLPPGSDPRATPACVNSCIADALHFGDLDDAEQQRLEAAACAQKFPHARRTRHRAGLPLSLRQGRCRAGAGCAAGDFGSASRARPHPRGRALASETLGLEGLRQFPVRRRRRRTVSVCHDRQLCWNPDIAAGSCRARNDRARPDAVDVQDRPAVALPLRAAPAAAFLDVARSLGRRRAVSARTRGALVWSSDCAGRRRRRSGCCFCSARA